MKPVFAVLAAAAAILWVLQQSFAAANRDVMELSARRKQDIVLIRPALLSYRKDKGRFPSDLAELIPGYLPSIPASLISPAGQDAALVIRYKSVGDGRQAHFSFHAHRGPDSTVTVDAATGDIRHDP